MHDCHALRHTRGQHTRHRNPAAHQHPLPTAHTSRRRSSYMSSYCPLQLVHTRSTRAAWRLSPANAKFQAPGGIYTARPTPMQRIVTCAAAGRCVRTRRVCVQQAAVALTSRQQRRCTLSRTLLVRLSDEGYPSLEGASSVHCMARCRRPTSLALSSSSCLGTRWPRANRTVCPNTFRLLWSSCCVRNLGGFGFLGTGATPSPPPGRPNGERNGSRPARRGCFL